MKRILLLILTIFLSSLVACKGKKVEGKQEFVESIADEPEYVDPGQAADIVSTEVTIQLFEGLLEFDPKTAEPIPALATRYDVSSDGKTYTFHLRRDGKWSNGEPVTARDFVSSWRRTASPAFASQYAFLTYFIVNGEEINNGKIKDLSKLGVKALDDYTIEVNLVNPTPFFPGVVSFPPLRPVHQKTIEAYGDRWTRPEHIVGNGPFILAEWIPYKHLLMKPNPHYWDRANVKLETVKFLPINDQEVALKRFLSGEIHYVRDVPALKIPMLEKHEEFVRSPQLATYYLLMNVNRPQFKDKRVRQALMMAIDRQKLVDVVHVGKPTSALTPPGTAGYQPPEGLPFNPERAKALLAEAGYPEGKNFPKTIISYETSDNNKTIMELIQNMWREYLGIKVELQNMDWKTLLKAREAQDYDIARSRWVGDYVDPNTFLELYLSYHPMNEVKWVNKEYDDLITKAAATLSQKERYALFTKAEKILLDEAPILPVYTITMSAMMSKKLTGFYSNLLDFHSLKGVTLK